MKIKRILILAALVLCLSHNASAQRWSFGTNLVDWANLGTVNLEIGMSIARHMSIDAGIKYNPWTFNGEDADKQFENRKRTAFAGIRIWPWYIFSGWWFELAGQYQEYNRGGWMSKTRLTEEGDAVGGVVSAGYTLILHKAWNVEFGLSAWGGVTNYTTYQCPQCGKVVESGRKGFFLPNDAMISFVYIF